MRLTHMSTLLPLSSEPTRWFDIPCVLLYCCSAAVVTLVFGRTCRQICLLACTPDMTTNHRRRDAPVDVTYERHTPSSTMADSLPYSLVLVEAPCIKGDGLLDLHDRCRPREGISLPPPAVREVTPLFT